jgi:hypothetical protein
VKFETLFLELVDSTEMIRSLLAGITQEESRVKPNPESWSILETLCHLCDEEREDFRKRLDVILHRPTEKWPPIAPQEWVRARKYNEQDFKKMKERFLSERSQSLDWLKGQSNSDWDSNYTSDLGLMTAGDMLACWIAHDNLALRQLVELRRARVEKIAKPYSIAYAGDW